MFTEAFDTMDVMDVVPDLTPAPPDAYAPGPGGPYDDDVPDFADDGIATPAEKAWYKWKHGKNAHGAALGETAATREGDPAMMEDEANSEKSHADKRTAKQGKSDGRATARRASSTSSRAPRCSSTRRTSSTSSRT